MAELQALQRAVWGDVTYERHLADRRLRKRRAIASGLMAFGVVAAGLALAVTTRPGTDELAQRELFPARRGTPSTRAAPRDRDRTVTTRPPAPTSTRAPVVTATAAPRTTVPGTTAPRTSTTEVRARRPQALARTGGSTGVLFVVGILLLASGLAIRRGKWSRRSTRAS